MSRIAAVIFAATIVEKREELDDYRVCACVLGNAEAVLTHSLPVGYTMDAVQFQHESFLGGPHDLIEVRSPTSKHGIKPWSAR
jgi:hypothetical protein